MTVTNDRGLRAVRIGLRAAALAAATMLSLHAPLSEAQILERVEVSRTNGHAEIRIDFGIEIQYLRHAPPGKGRELNIFIRRTLPVPPETDVVTETLTAPRTDIVPPFTVTYPKLGNAVNISFAQETSWEVRPGPDSRSIVVVVPVLRGARDVVVEVRAAPPPKPAPVPVVEPGPAPSVAAAPAMPVPTTPSVPVPAVAAAVPAPTAPAAPAPLVAAPTIAAAPPPEPLPPPTPSPQPPAAPPPQTPAPPAPLAPAAEAPPPDAIPAVPVLTTEQVESFAQGFMADARKALEEGDLARATNRLNRTLGLPSNNQTESAQALIGEVRELNGEIAKARAEYELYLKLYPKGPQTSHVKERLAALPKSEPRSEARRRPLRRGPAEWMVYGGLSQYYYTGKSHIEVTTPPPPGLLDFTTDVLSLTDQDALITNLDLNARRRDGITDTRIVLRNTDTQNYLDRSRSYNRLYSAYVEQSDKELGYFVRAGRQTPTGGGVLERFDGLNVGYNFSDRWRINGVAGDAVEFLSPFKKNFYGVSLDMQPQPDEFGFGVYALRQTLDGFLNRQAVGIETRYFDMHATLYGMLDYDTLYKGINIAMLQGNYRSDEGTNYFTYIDHRKTPPYSLSNALPGLAGMSIKDAIAAQGIDQVRADAMALTATSNMLAVGLTHPLSPRWTLGTDYRAAAISSTEATATMPAMAGSGTNHVFSLQAIGNSLMATNDVGVINTSYIKGATYNGTAIGGNYVFPYGDAWRFDFNLRYYTQSDDFDEKQVRTSPSLKIAYRWNPVTIEAEAGAENVSIDGPSRTERSNRRYVFVGYRLDFR
ncbi:MAG: hypothetical protein KJ634_12545 [Gammaproteobacteria bacterium]|nr:hypothetical protein [Gammaproteobacteria bacterium]MBU1416443.1 hypothetical protein [Gammaproteobacteria bacterium]